MTFSSFLKTFPTKNFSAHEMLIYSGETPTTLFYVKSGFIRKFTTSPEGKELTLHIFEKGATFPLSWALNNTTPNYSFEALTKVTVYLVPREKFVEYIKQNPQVLFKYSQNILRGIEGLSKRVEVISMDNANKRVRSLLYYLVKHFGHKKGKIISLKPHFTHEDMAALTGLTRERVSIEMERLKEEGIISYTHKEVLITKIAEL